jgi:triosephosphate isomerase
MKLIKSCRNLLPAFLVRRTAYAFSFQQGGAVANTQLIFFRSLSESAAKSTKTTLNATPEHAWYEDSRTASSKRPMIIAGNWKLNPGTISEASNLLKLIASNFVHHRTTYSSAEEIPEVVIFPPFPYLSLALTELEGTGIKVGAQNVGLETTGAFTGEVSASMIRSMGCDYVMLGHSERRTLFGETDSKINQKVHLCMKQPNLKVILCVGETQDEYNNKLLSSVVDIQLKKGLAGLSAADAANRITIAYEPVWAIGTGKVATPTQANQAHQAVRSSLAALFGQDVAKHIRIQYGGSVSPDNAANLLSMEEIDGALVGGASLNADSFTRIVDGGIPNSGLATIRPLELTAQECVSTKNVLGESPVWSDRDQCLYWVSAPEEEVWRWDMKSPPYRRLVGTTLGCVVVKAGPTGSIVLGGENAILQMDMTATTKDFSNGASILCDRPDLESTTRPNDGRVDRQGRFVFGMYNNYHRSGASEGENNAGLFRLGPDLQYEKILDYGFRVSNCICFPADGRTMYFCDTPTRKVYAFDYPQEPGGQLSNRRLIWTVPANLSGGPDGAQVDADGFLYIALSGAGRVVRVNPSTGTTDMVIYLPVQCPTSCTFGGPDLDELFITTRGPDGGGLYRVKMPYGIRGLPEPEFSVFSSADASSSGSESARAMGTGYSEVPQHSTRQESHGTYH